MAVVAVGDFDDPQVLVYFKFVLLKKSNLKGNFGDTATMN